MRPFEYIRPESIDETLSLLGQSQDGATQLLAGGTDLLTLMKADIQSPARLVDIKRLDALPRGIEETENGVSLGTLTSLAEIETSALIAERYPLLAEAAAVAATPQLRHMATLGGNLLQRPRCWYFRNSLFQCWLKGGDACQAVDGQNQLHALFGGGPCYAVHPSDLAPTLLALGAEVRLRGPQGERRLPLADFYALPQEGRRQETIISPDELLLSVHIPPLPAGTRSTYLKAMERKVWAFALVSVAAVVTMAEGKVEDVHVVLGGVAPIPWRAKAAEQALIGAEPNEALLARAASAAVDGADPLTHNAYKVRLAENLVGRALTSLANVATR